MLESSKFEYRGTILRIKIISASNPDLHKVTLLTCVASNYIENMTIAYLSLQKKVLLFCPRLRKPKVIRQRTLTSPQFVLSSLGTRLLSKFSCTAIPAGSVCRLTQNKHRMAQSLVTPPAPTTVLMMDKQKRQVRSVII